MPENIIELKGVNKWFGDFQVLKDVDLEVGLKQKIVVCGPSGSGKSTMIRCINRLEEHQQGKIVVDGIELTGNLKNIDSELSHITKNGDIVVGKLEELTKAFSTYMLRELNDNKDKE